MDVVHNQKKKSLQKVRQCLNPLKIHEKNHDIYLVQENNKADLARLRQIQGRQNSQSTVDFSSSQSRLLLPGIPVIQILAKGAEISATEGGKMEDKCAALFLGGSSCKI